MKIKWSQLDREIASHWKADGASKEEIECRMAERHARVASHIAPKDGERGPVKLAELFGRIPRHGG